MLTRLPSWVIVPSVTDSRTLLSICEILYFTALLAGAALAAPPDIRAVVTATIAVSTAMNTRVRLRVGLTDILDCFLSADCYSGDSQVDADLLRRPDELIGDT